jgi:hypothetical protein
VGGAGSSYPGANNATLQGFRPSLDGLPGGTQPMQPSPQVRVCPTNCVSTRFFPWVT